MGNRSDPAGAPADSGNVPGNPLRSYRMSMLAHGFVQHDGSVEFELDESDPINYGVVRRGGRVPMATAITVAVLLVVLVVAGYLLG